MYLTAGIYYIVVRVFGVKLCASQTHVAVVDPTTLKTVEDSEARHGACEEETTTESGGDMWREGERQIRRIEKHAHSQT